MKGAIIAAVAVLAGAASADVHHGHHHELFAHKRGDDTASTCTQVCKTYWTTITGAPTRAYIKDPPHPPRGLNMCWRRHRADQKLVCGRM